ncbi:hypothetical protein K501DRAFT_286066 [Backusella circina FSU 941]|nr:hypothetical protein K501DRAFT_286066 [Backusella circina FSU 941]
MSYIETPLLANVPSLDEWKKLDVGRHRFSWISKIEAVASILSASLYFNWHHRIVTNNGFIDSILKGAVLAPIIITTVQSIYFVPHFLKLANSVDQGEVTAQALWSTSLFQRHRQYIALDTVKVTCLGLAGWRFGKMLKN